jgi:hypothetical protein
MAQSKGHKQFPFKWRAAWLALGRANPTAAYVWDYMFWRSDKDNIFDLEESLVCKDTGLERKTLCKARSLVAKHGGFRRLYSRNPQGQLIVKYQMLGFEEGEQVPENGTSNKSQQTGLEPSTVLRNPVKRDHTVDTPPVDTSNQKPVDTEVSELVSEEDACSLRSQATARESSELRSPEPPPATDRERALAFALHCNVTADERIALRDFFEMGFTEEEFWDFWHWNQQHKSGGLQFATLREANNALHSGSSRSAWKQWQRHKENPCRKCKHVPMPDLPNESRLCSECDVSHSRASCPCFEAMAAAKAGRQAFEIEEDLG